MTLLGIQGTRTTNNTQYLKTCIDVLPMIAASLVFYHDNPQDFASVVL